MIGGTEINLKKFKTYTAKKYRVWRRILFFAVVALLIFAFTVILGNVLKKRLDNTEVSTDDIPSVTSSADTAPADDLGVTAVHDEALKGVSASCLDLSGVSDGAGARSVIDEMRSAGCNAVSFVVRGSDGMLSYASPALQSYSGVKASDSLVSFDVLSAAVVYAKDRGIRCSAVFSGNDILHDAIISEELINIGFNDILIRGFEGLSALDNSAVGDIGAYVSAVKGSTDVTCGVSLSSEVLMTAQNAPYIEKLYNMCEYLAINMTEMNKDSAADICSKLQGSFSMYMLRPVLRGDNAELADAVRNVLVDLGIGARQYISSVPKPAADPAAE